MAIAPINYATIQRTADIETFKNQQDTKPMVDQQNIQVQLNIIRCRWITGRMFCIIRSSIRKKMSSWIITQMPGKKEKTNIKNRDL